MRKNVKNLLTNGFIFLTSPPPATEYAFPSSHTTPWGTEVFPDRDWTQGRWGAVRVTGVCGMERSER